MELLHIILNMIGVLLAASAIAVFARGLVYPLCLAACAALFAVNADVLLSAAPAGETLILPFGLPLTGVHLRLDMLSAFFGIVVNLGGVLASLYGIGYGRNEPHPLRILPFYPAFIAGMNLVLVADDAFTFLVAWEFMSLSSWALVMAYHKEADNRRAGYIYLLMANLGTLALLFAFGALAGPGGAYAFDAIRSATSHPALMTALALVMTLAGAGSKAGIVPLHVWLPLAHPAAPSHVSALMSGVMTKVAIYAIMRVMFDLCGPLGWWWAMPPLLLGGVSAVLGILYAIMQRDIKKLLAYSTIENIGIIVVGLGLALAFRTNGMNAAAALAVTAALLHVFNHSLFKSLLFLGAGSVAHSTGLRDIERLGGLIHRMPVTAVLFLVGCIAVAALPPLNGFVSEWMTFQAILASPDLSQPELRFMVPVIGIMMALAAALAATCFVKVFGIVFLGRSRSEAASAAHETDRYSLTAMAVLAALCGLCGLFASLLVKVLGPLSAQLVGTALPNQNLAPTLFSLGPFTAAHSSYNAPVLAFFMLLSGCVTVWFIHTFASRQRRPGALWDCGFPDSVPMGQYTASSFTQPIRRVFGTFVFRAREEVLMPAPGETTAAKFSVRLVDPVWDTLYAPVSGIVQSIAARLNGLQFMTIQHYLMWVFFTLISLLVVVALWH